VITVFLTTGRRISDDDRYTITLKDYGVRVHDAAAGVSDTYPWHRVNQVTEKPWA
jgi:hypothetical protein